ncbi:hypothetical protein MXB_3827, partial [Myxobolus squamalis]
STEETSNELHHDLNEENDLPNKLEKIKIDHENVEKNDPLMIDSRSSDLYPEKNHVFILYASQSGTGKTFSESLHRFLKKVSIGSILSDLAEFNLVPNAVVVFFLSTFGDGEPPDTGYCLEEWLNSSPNVKDMNYASKRCS